jgi:hypothetical protein
VNIIDALLLKAEPMTYAAKLRAVTYQPLTKEVPQILPGMEASFLAMETVLQTLPGTPLSLLEVVVEAKLAQVTVRKALRHLLKAKLVRCLRPPRANMPNIWQITPLGESILQKEEQEDRLEGLYNQVKEAL